MEEIKEYIALTSEEIEKDYNEIKILYEKFLKQYKINLPKKNTNAMYQLIYLYHFLGKAIHKDAISTFVQSQNPNASGDQQIRHLGAQKGYCVIYNGNNYKGNVVKKGYYCLFTLKEPNPNWNERQEARTISTSTNEFNTLKLLFNNCCATCGAKEGTKHKYTGQIVKLQKGHCDPSKPLENGNIIPQCEYCNQNIYKNDFIFTLEGRPKSIYNPRYILKSNEAIQREMYNILKEKFDK